MPDVDNPFNAVVSTLWDLALAHTRLAALVKVGNRIRYDQSELGAKETVQPADLPELALLSNGIIAGNLHADSTNAMLKRRYTFQITTGTYKIETLNVVEWYLICALTDWQSALTALKWNNKTFVKNCNIASVDDGFSNAELNRGIKGWSALWSCEIDFWFRQADLRAEINPTA